MKRGGRVLAGFAAALLAVTLMPAIASATHGPHNQPRNFENACPPDSTRDHFDDDEASTFEDAINCVAEYAIAVGGVGGRPSNEYSPGLPVSRAQMASFVMRKLDLVFGYERPANAPDEFPDDDGNTHEGNINDAAAENIARGYQDGTFRPDNNVTRGEMASFIVREMRTAGANLPENPENAFPDAEGSAHHENLNILHEMGIYVGRTDGTSGFTEPINREQMAALLARNLGELVAQGLAPPVTEIDREPQPEPDRGPATALALTPDTDINPVGANHTVTAELEDAEGDPAREGELVRFEVFRDTDPSENEGTLVFVGGGSDTATGGTADFTYGGPATNRQDVVVACVVPDDQTACTSGTTLQRSTTGAFSNITADVADTANKEWTQRHAAALVLTPETDVNPVGDDHTVTATVTDQFGDPVRGQNVVFEVFRDTDFDGNFQFDQQGDTITGGTNIAGAPATHNEPGQATFTFTGNQGGLYRVVACTDADNDANCADVANVGNPGPTGPIVLDEDEVAIDTADKEFVTAQAAAAGAYSGTVIACDNPNDQVRIFTEDGRHLILTHESTDQFTVDGQPATQTGFEGQCTPNDQLSGNYNPATGVQSTFNLVNRPAS